MDTLESIVNIAENSINYISNDNRTRTEKQKIKEVIFTAVAWYSNLIEWCLKTDHKFGSDTLNAVVNFNNSYGMAYIGALYIYFQSRFFGMKNKILQIGIPLAGLGWELAQKSDILPGTCDIPGDLIAYSLACATGYLLEKQHIRK